MTVKERAPAESEAPERREHEINLRLRVYLYMRDGRWYADTPDLTLMTEGASEEEALRCLLEQVQAYLRTAVDRGWMDRLHRPASLRHRLWLTFQFLLAKLRHRPASVRIKPIAI